jgi:hypothetical protein
MRIANIWRIFRNKHLGQGIIGLLYQIIARAHRTDMLPKRNPSRNNAKNVKSFKVAVRVMRDGLEEDSRGEGNEMCWNSDLLIH